MSSSERPQETLQVSEQKETMKNRTPLTPEAIFSNKEYAKKIYDVLISESDDFDPHREIDFGPQYEKTDMDTVLYYVYSYFGFREGYGRLAPYVPAYENIKEFLRILLKVGDDEARAFLKRKQQEETMDIEVAEKWLGYMQGGFLLSSIIDGAPELVTEKLQVPTENEKPGFSGLSTGKVCDLLDLDDEEASSKIIDIFKDKTVVDLGAGEYGTGFKLAKKTGARNYVAVEPFNTLGLLDSIRHEVAGSLQKDPSNETLPQKVHVSKSDMKTFLSKLPNNAQNVSFLISGVDGYILHSYDYLASTANNSDDEIKKIKAGQKYIADVEKELKRVLASSQSVLVYASSIGFTDEDGFDKTKFYAFEGPVYVYTKR